MTEAFNNLNKIITKPAQNSGELEDECDVFGKLIAKKLKKLAEHEQEDLMFDIHALFRRSRVERSPSVESFILSTPKSTSHHSLTPSLYTVKRPRSESSVFHCNAETFSSRPRSSHSEPPNVYVIQHIQISLIKVNTFTSNSQPETLHINTLQRYVS